MIKMYVMKTCPYCEYVEKQVKGNNQFEVIDISTHVRKLKEFLDLRDNNSAFDEAKKIGDVGMPQQVRCHIEVQAIHNVGIVFLMSSQTRLNSVLDALSVHILIIGTLLGRPNNDVLPDTFELRI